MKGQQAQMKQAILAKQAARSLLAVTEQQRQQALLAIAVAMENNMAPILAANAQDIEAGREAGLSVAKIDRLLLTEDRLLAMADSVRAIAEQEPVVGIIDHELTRDDGLKILAQRVPIGVLAMIFESRPNVVIDCSALAIKSGNAIILKGGKEALHSNRALFNLVNEACQGLLPDNSVQLVEDRADVTELLQQRGLVDLIIPRGGEGLVSFVEANSTVPVLAHHKGLCHLYVHPSAVVERIIPIILNAKVQRPGVCNALETLLLDERLNEQLVLDVLSALQQAGVTLRLDDTCPAVEGAETASEEDWDTEYLDLMLSVKMVSGVEAACEHINQHGSQHTEAILATDQNAIDYFSNHVDASALMINASTRFNDGGEFQLGAELGISTTKLHAYGPMGAREMTICRHLVVGEGHIRG